MSRFRALALAVGWLVAALLFSLGAAGIVTGIGGTPGSAERPELTSAGDRAMAPGLAAATDDLEGLAASVEALGTSARLVLAALVATDLDLVQETIDKGSAQAIAIRADADELRQSLLALPGVAPDAVEPLPAVAELRLGRAMRERFEVVYGALEATSELQADWARLSASSLAAQGLTTVLLEHDASTAEAARLGSSERYADALAKLDTSDVYVATAKGARDTLANTVDVTVLSEWIARNETYDAALRTLYEALRASGGRVTDQVRAAFEAEQAARERLPPDTRGLVVILAEIARGGMNQAAISIEDAAMRLGRAVATAEDLAAPPSPSASPSPPASPSPSASSSPPA